MGVAALRGAPGCRGWLAWAVCNWRVQAASRGMHIDILEVSAYSQAGRTPALATSRRVWVAKTAGPGKVGSW